MAKYHDTQMGYFTARMAFMQVKLAIANDMEAFDTKNPAAPREARREYREAAYARHEYDTKRDALTDAENAMIAWAMTKVTRTAKRKGLDTNCLIEAQKHPELRDKVVEMSAKLL